jgi:hypothetical protein
MRYWVCTIAGLALAGASIVLLDSGIFHVVRIGSCGSSTNFVSTRPCPPGTGAQILSIIGGVFGGLIALGIYAARGTRGGTGASVSFGVIMWSLLFVTIGLSTVYAAYGPGNTGSSGAKTTAIILGVIFVPMGLIPLPFALRGGGKKATAAAPDFAYSRADAAAAFAAPPVAPAPATPPAPAEDPLEQIAKLGQLRDRGLLTPQEFEAQKKKLLGEV